MKRATIILSLALALALPLSTYAASDASSSGKRDAQATVTTKVVATKAPATNPAEPKDMKEAAGAVGEAIKAGKAGNWWYMSSLICLLLMFVLKLSGALKELGRWKYVILPVLALAAALLAAFQGGVSLEAAAGVFTSTWATGMLEELWSHGVLGKPKASRAPS